MTTTEFYTLLKAVDSGVSKWSGPGTGNYTVYQPLGFPRVMADGINCESAMRIAVHRFTRLDNDTVAPAIDAILSNNDSIASSYIIDFETDTGYIHHTWTCEVV